MSDSQDKLATIRHCRAAITSLERVIDGTLDPNQADPGWCMNEALASVKRARKRMGLWPQHCSRCDMTRATKVKTAGCWEGVLMCAKCKGTYDVE